MLPGSIKNTNIGLGLGLLASFTGRAMVNNGYGLGVVVAVLGAIIFIWGCSEYAKGKGYSPWLGALGLLSIIGLIILVLLKDKHK